jgi:hypothetical protein
MRRAPKLIALAILALIWAACVAGCVSVPVPLADMGNIKAGQLGNIEARFVVAYKPNLQGLAQAATDRLFKRGGYAK